MNNTVDLITEIYQFFLGAPDYSVYERTDNGNLFRIMKVGDELRVTVFREDTSLFEKSIQFEYLPMRYTLGHVFSKGWKAVFDARSQRGVVSNSDTYNYTIEHFADYGLNLDDRQDMLRLNNIMEAHGESLEDLGDYTAEAFDFGCNDRADAAEWYLETNAFWNSWNEFAEWALDTENDIDSVKESLLSSLMYGNLVKTTDGIVELSVV